MEVILKSLKSFHLQKNYYCYIVAPFVLSNFCLKNFCTFSKTTEILNTVINLVFYKITIYVYLVYHLIQKIEKLIKTILNCTNRNEKVFVRFFSLARQNSVIDIFFKNHLIKGITKINLMCHKIYKNKLFEL